MAKHVNEYRVPRGVAEGTPEFEEFVANKGAEVERERGTTPGKPKVVKSADAGGERLAIRWEFAGADDPATPTAEATATGTTTAVPIARFPLPDGEVVVEDPDAETVAVARAVPGAETTVGTTTTTTTAAPKATAKAAPKKG